MGWIIVYVISIFLFYLVFFKIRHFSHERVYLDDNEKAYYKNYEYRWIDKGRCKLPLWVWLLGFIILAIPVLNIVVYIAVVISVMAGGYNDCDDRFVLCNGLIEFLKKEY